MDTTAIAWDPKMAAVGPEKFIESYQDAIHELL